VNNKKKNNNNIKMSSEMRSVPDPKTVSLKVRVPDIYIPPLAEKPKQQRFTI